MEAEMEKPKPIDIDGTDVMSTVLLDLLNEFPGLNGKHIAFSTLGESNGMGFFPSPGAIIVSHRESIIGHVEQTCQYPFMIIYRSAPKTEAQRLKIKEFLDTIGKWAEMQEVNLNGSPAKLEAYPVLSGTRIIKDIKRNTPGHLSRAGADGVEDWAINMSLQYENSYDR